MHCLTNSIFFFRGAQLFSDLLFSDVSISSFPVDTTGALLLELLFVVSASVKYRIDFLRRYFRTKTVPDRSLFVLFIDAIRIGTKMAAEERRGCLLVI